MTVDDIGYIADLDETFSRDYLRAVQTCDGIDQLNYELHNCRHNLVKIFSNTTVFESSPECISDGRSWRHPDMIIGACIEGFANSTQHPPAPRQPESYQRMAGFGTNSSDWEREGRMKDNRYPSWNAADFRRTRAGLSPRIDRTRFPNYSVHTGFHFHNFFDSIDALRRKYRTFGHEEKKAYTHRLQDLSNDLTMMVRCVTNETDKDTQKWKRVTGGFEALDQPLPIYFHDVGYPRRRHNAIREMVIADETECKRRQNCPRV